MGADLQNGSQKAIQHPTQFEENRFNAKVMHTFQFELIAPQ